MPDSVLITETYGRVLLAPEVPCLMIGQWHPFANRQQFRSFMDRCLALCVQGSQRTRPLGLPGDTRHVSAVTSDGQNRLRTDWNPGPTPPASGSWVLWPPKVYLVSYRWRATRPTPRRPASAPST